MHLQKCCKTLTVYASGLLTAPVTFLVCLFQKLRLANFVSAGQQSPLLLLLASKQN